MKVNKNKFFWGVASSAFQIEGQIENDMTEWERIGKFRQNGKNPIYDTATNHWDLWEQDFDLLKQLNVNAYRFSIEWARIEPEQGQIDQSALKKYHKMINKLTDLKIEPILTLHHFTHPKWFHETSPWHEPESIENFVNYARLIIENLAEKISWYITFNEPLVWLLAAYGDAKFPPGEKDFNKLMQALSNMLKAHQKLYDIIKKINPKARVGIAKNFIIFKPNNKYNIFDIALNNLAHSFYNEMLLKVFQTNRLQFNFPLFFSHDEYLPLKNTLDFIGINYYYRMHTNFKLHLKNFIDLGFKQNRKFGNSDLDWETYPKGISKVIKWVSYLEIPIMITENGVAAEDDNKRIKYLKWHLNKIEKNLKKGKNIIGYFHWAFLDNYEWLEGKSARFGLVHVDYKNNFERSIKKSGQYYATYIESKKHSIFET